MDEINNNIQLSNSDLKELILARNSLMTNVNETISEHSKNNELFVSLALKYNTTNQKLWDYIQLNHKQK